MDGWTNIMAIARRFALMITLHAENNYQNGVREWVFCARSRYCCSTSWSTTV